MESLHTSRSHLFRKYVVFSVTLVGVGLLASGIVELSIANAVLRTGVLLMLGLALSVLASFVLARERANVHAGLTEALEQQTAMREILHVINSLPTDVQPVFDMIAQSAVRLCGGQFCAVHRFDG